LLWLKALSRGKTYPHPNLYQDLVTNTSVKPVSWHYYQLPSKQWCTTLAFQKAEGRQ